MDKYITDYWKKNMNDIIRWIRVHDIEHILACKYIFANMVQIYEDIYKNELQYLLKYINMDEINNLTKDHAENEKYNPVHMLYAIKQYENNTGMSIKDIKSIVEYGGGYGCMARLIKKINPDVRYTIIDLPIMTDIQREYLKGYDVNFVSLDKIESFKGRYEMFLSTWAFTECTNELYDFIISKKFYNAKKFLIAYLLTYDLSKKLEKEFEDKDKIITEVISIRYFKNRYSEDNLNRFLFI